MSEARRPLGLKAILAYKFAMAPVMLGLGLVLVLAPDVHGIDHARVRAEALRLQVCEHADHDCQMRQIASRFSPHALGQEDDRFRRLAFRLDDRVPYERRAAQYCLELLSPVIRPEELNERPCVHHQRAHHVQPHLPKAWRRIMASSLRLTLLAFSLKIPPPRLNALHGRNAIAGV